MEPFVKQYEIDTRMVDMHNRLLPSQLLLILQDAAVRHAVELGAGDAVTRGAGYAWVVARQVIEIARMPLEKEVLTLRTWPGEARLLLMPRYTEIADAQGNVIIRTAAVWTLMNLETRKAASTKEAGITLPMLKTGTEIPFLQKLKPLEEQEQFLFTVPYSYCDVNHHLNNARYLDIVTDHAAEAPEGKELQKILIEYQSEVRYGEELSVSHGAQEGCHYFAGRVGERDCFKVRLEYRN